MAKWKIPPFQRPLRINSKVLAFAEELKKDGGIITGVITLGRLVGDRETSYIVDGEHRIEAFKISEMAEACVDVRVIEFDTMAEMSLEFVRLNEQLVKMRPDDFLRGMEGLLPTLKKIRENCSLVGYAQIRRGSPNAPMVGMSALLKAWAGSQGDTPTTSAGAATAMQLAQQLAPEDADQLIEFMTIARAAWGNDPETYRLWSSFHLTLMMWCYRKLVLDRERQGSKRWVVLTNDQFKRCMMALAADANYCDWLVGRNTLERDRSGAWGRIKRIFNQRLQVEFPNRKFQLPQPDWASR